MEAYKSWGLGIPSTEYSNRALDRGFKGGRLNLKGVLKLVLGPRSTREREGVQGWGLGTIVD